MFCLSSEQQDWWWGQLLDRKKGIVVFTLLFALSSWENLAKNYNCQYMYFFACKKLKKLQYLVLKCQNSKTRLTKVIIWAFTSYLLRINRAGHSGKNVMKTWQCFKAQKNCCLSLYTGWPIRFDTQGLNRSRNTLSRCPDAQKVSRAQLRELVRKS